jgi:photosystem II stability/assembly factor-like uncharacterized protein
VSPAGGITLLAISFTDATHGWVVGALGFIFHTQDAGATWKLQGATLGLVGKSK